MMKKWMKRLGCILPLFVLPSCHFYQNEGIDEVIYKEEQQKPEADCTFKQVDLNAEIIIEEEEFTENLEQLFLTHGVLVNRFVFAVLNQDTQESLDSEKRSLFENSKYLANLIAYVYGSRIGKRFEYLFNRHIKLTLAYIYAVKDCNPLLAQEIEKQALANGDLLIEFLNLINPYFPLKPERYMFEEHVTLEMQQITAYLNGNYERAEKIKEQYFKQLEEMGRQWAKAIILQFTSQTVCL